MLRKSFGNEMEFIKRRGIRLLTFVKWYVQNHEGFI